MKITQSIDNGNQLLNLDLVPRDEQGNKVNPVTCSDITPDQKGVLELYNIVSSCVCFLQPYCERNFCEGMS